MIERTQTALNLLDVMQELEILDCSFLNSDGWIKVTDRKTLYRAAIVALLEAAETEGFQMTTGGVYLDIIPSDAIDIEDTPDTEACDDDYGPSTALDPDRERFTE